MRINVYKILPDLDLGNVYQILYKATNEHLKKRKISINKIGIPSVIQKHQTPWMSIDNPPPQILLFNGVSLEAHEAWSYATRTNWNYSEGDIVEGWEQTDCRRTESKRHQCLRLGTSDESFICHSPNSTFCKGKLFHESSPWLTSSFFPFTDTHLLTPGKSQLEISLFPRYM